MNQLKLFLLVICLGVYGCSAVKKVQETGFLNNYSQLKTLPNSPETQYFETDCALWKKYQEVIVDPVEIHFTKDAEAKIENVEIPEVQELADFFRNAMIDALKDSYQITTEPGQNVLRVRTAIVDVKPVDVMKNLISKAFISVPVDLGQAAIEGELVDSLTGERFAAIVDRKIGSMLSFTGAYTTWGATKSAFEDWAGQLSDLMRSMLQRNTQSIESFSVYEVNSDTVELKLSFASPPSLSKQFSTQRPARISLDFSGTRNGLKKKFNQIGTGPISSIAVVENGCRTRVVIQLKSLSTYNTQVLENSLIIQINK